jgi:hypothetical protein
MADRLWRPAELRAQEVHWTPVVVQGHTVGALVKLRRAVLFYAWDPRLARLDGRRFETPTAARRAARAALLAPAPCGPDAADLEADA